MPSVGELRAEFTIDLKPLRSGLRSAARDLEQFQKRYARKTDLRLSVNREQFVSELRAAARPVEALRKSFAKPVQLQLEATGAPAVLGVLTGVKTAHSALNGNTATVAIGERGAKATNAVIDSVRRNAERGAELRVDTNPARVELRGYNETLRRYARSWGQQGIRTRVTADVARATANLRRLEAIAETATGARKILVDAEVLRARGKLQALAETADSLGLKSSTVTVGLRGYLATRAQMLGLMGLADRLDGYNAEFTVGIDQRFAKALPSVFADFEAAITRFQSVQAVLQSVRLPALLGKFAELSTGAAVAAGAGADFARVMSQGVAGSLGSVGGALVGSGAALLGYGAAVERTYNFVGNFTDTLYDQYRAIDDANKVLNQAKDELKKTAKGTREYELAARGVALAEQNAAYEQKRFNTMLGLATPSIVKLNGRLNEARLGALRFGGSVANEVAPTMTKFVDTLSRFGPGFTRGFTGMVGDMNRVSESFLRAATSGERLGRIKSLFSDVASLGAPALRTLTNGLLTMVDVLHVVSPSWRPVVGAMEAATTAARKWTDSARGQERIRDIWAGMMGRARGLQDVLVDLGVAGYGVFRALEQAGTGNQLFGYLKDAASGLRGVTAEGTKGNAAITQFGRDSKPVLAASASLAKAVFFEFGRVARAVLDVKGAGSQLPTLASTIGHVEQAVHHLGTAVIVNFRRFGPVMGPTIENFARFFSVFGPVDPILVGFLKTMNGVLDLFFKLPSQAQYATGRIIGLGFALKQLGALQFGGSLVSGLTSLYTTSRTVTAANRMAVASTRQLQAAQASASTSTNALAASQTRLAASTGMAGAGARRMAAGNAAAGAAAAGAAKKTGLLSRAGLALKGALGAASVALTGLSLPVVAAGAAIAGAAYLIYRNWDKVKKAGSALVGWYQRNFPKTSATIGRTFRTAAQATNAFVRGGLDVLRRAAAATVSWFARHWPQINRVIVAGGRAFGRGLRIMTAPMRLLVAAGRGVVGFFAKNWPAISRVAQNTARNVSRSLSWLKNDAVSWVRSLVGSLANFWKNRVWQPMATWVQKKRDGVMQTLGNWKERAVAWVKGLVGPVVNFWKNRIWQPMATWVQQKRDGVMQTLANWRERSVSWVNGFREKVGSLWNKAWQGMADFVVAKKEGILQTVGNLASGIRSGFEGIVGFINKVLSAVKLPTINIDGGSAPTGKGNQGANTAGGKMGSTGVANGGVYEAKGMTKLMATGGIVAQNADGGVSDGRMPRAVYGEGRPGEGPQKETYAVHGRKDQIPYGEAFANSVGMTMVPKRLVPHSTKEHYTEGEKHIHAMARGGVLAAWKRMGVPMHSYGVSGSTSEPWVANVNEAIEGKHGVQGTTYEGHGAQGNARTSVDWLVAPQWNVEATGAAKAKGDAIVQTLSSEFAKLTEYIIWFGKANYSGKGGSGWETYTGGGGYAAPSSPSGYHTDHVHWSSTPDGQPGGFNGSGGGSGGFGGFAASLWDTAGQAIWNRLVQPAVDSLAGRVGGASNGIFGDVGAKLVTSTADKVKDYIIGEAGSSGGISGGSSPKGLTIGEALSQGNWPDNLLVPASSVVWHESTGNASVRNPSSTATGLMQILHSTAEGVGADPSKLTDPIYNTSTGKKVYDQAGGFGPWVAAGRGGDYRDKPVTGYAKGGVTGSLGYGGAKLEMPSRVGNAFALVANTLRSLAGKSGAGGMLVGDEGGVGDGKRIVAITNEAREPEGIMPLRNWTPGGQRAFDAGKKLYERGHRAGVRFMASGGVLGVPGGRAEDTHPGTPAQDVFAPPGTAISAPWPLEITKSQQMGGSYGLQQWGVLSANGRSYNFVMGHLGSGAGQGKYRVGAKIGTIGNLPGITPHVHWGVSSSVMPPPANVDPLSLPAGPAGGAHDPSSPGGSGGASGGSTHTNSIRMTGKGSASYHSSQGGQTQSGSSGRTPSSARGGGPASSGGLAGASDADAKAMRRAGEEQLRKADALLKKIDKLTAAAERQGRDFADALRGKAGTDWLDSKQKAVFDRFEAVGKGA